MTTHFRLDAIPEHSHDVVVVGAGIAGLYAALQCRDLNVAVVSKVFPTRSHSVAAQGGTAAALGNVEEDSWEWHFFDTARGSDYLGDQDAQEVLCREAPEAIYDLEHLGVPFSRTAGGRIMQRHFGGHFSKFGQGPPVHRACCAADRIGHVILQTLYGHCLRHGVRFYSEFFVHRLLLEGGRCSGILAWDIINGGIHLFRAKALLFATGGYARAWRTTTNSFSNTGDGLGLVLKAGLPLEDMEFVQFHPTGLYPSGILISEGVRGEGGYLLNGRGERFMSRYAPDKMELAPRDITTRSIQTEIDNGLGIRGEPYVHLDISHIGAAQIQERLPQVRELAWKFAGVDVSRDPFPIAPTAHYAMGGIPVDLDGRVLSDAKGTPVTGFYAAGECSCVSVHGANRLGCNSTLDCSVYGRRVGRAMREFALSCGEGATPSAEQVRDGIVEIERLLSASGPQSIHAIRQALRDSMMNNCGIFRDKEKLLRQTSLVKELQMRYAHIGLGYRGMRFNSELQEAIEICNLLQFSEVIVAGALARTESRGAHYRTDHPERHDAAWLKHTLAWNTDCGVTLDYKPVVITRFQPARRVY
ncbi:MAG: succinate dehydrogenase flavoprotein subunit [Pseudomonadota bacterium]